MAARHIVCVDITALLTLAQFKLLHLLSAHFKRIYLARETKTSIQEEVLKHGYSHGIIEEIENWRMSSRHIVRVRSEAFSGEESEEKDDYVKTHGGILLKRKEPLSVLIPYGVGESVLLAKRLNIPLYCDESAVRHIAKEEYGVNSFCTITFIMQLRRELKVTILEESKLFSEMIRCNFRIVPFDVLHLTEALKEMRYNIRGTGKQMTGEMLQNDRILGAMFRQFGDSDLDEGIRMRIAVKWWFSILKDGHYGKDTLVQCMIYPLFCFSTQTKGWVLIKMKGNEHEIRVAGVLASFLLFTFRHGRQLMLEAWLSVRQCAEDLFTTIQGTVERILYNYIPNVLFQRVKGDRSLDLTAKTIWLSTFASSFPEDDRKRLEQELVKRIRNL